MYHALPCIPFATRFTSAAMRLTSAGEVTGRRSFVTTPIERFTSG
jgi:hypothetical protein